MTSPRATIAILGATGHVGKCLVAELASRYRLVAVVRDGQRMRSFLDQLPDGALCEVIGFEELRNTHCDAVVNCVGVGDPSTLIRRPSAVFEVTQAFDAVLMEYLEQHTEVRGISFSSGAAYLSGFDCPADEKTAASIKTATAHAGDFYAIAKLHSEARHRAAGHLSIVDIRLFGLFSRYADISTPYFMNDVVRALRGGEILKVGPENMHRDYVHPSDLAALIAAVIAGTVHNDVFDARSTAPVSKFDVLSEFSARYGLQYDVLGCPAGSAATGPKPNYYSINQRTDVLGWSPHLTSMESLITETDALLGHE